MALLRFAVIVGILVASGCSGRKLPADLNKSEVEAKIATSQKWHDVTLQDAIDGKYKGAAVTESGEKLNLEVRQGTDGISTDWTNADGTGGGHAKVSWH